MLVDRAVEAKALLESASDDERLITGKGGKTRQSILDTAVDMASVAGLEGLTIGQLATALQMSKSGLFAHFGSKENLQLAVVARARSDFVREVIRPALTEARGLPRLRALCREWISYAEGQVFRGGCFFASASAEFDGRPGRVRDALAEIMRSWLHVLELAVAQAQRAGHLHGDVDAAQLAFELHALALGGNWAHQLFGDREAWQRTRLAIDDRLQGVMAEASGKQEQLEATR